jgi:hypothetical protein
MHTNNSSVRRHFATAAIAAFILATPVWVAAQDAGHGYKAAATAPAKAETASTLP